MPAPRPHLGEPLALDLLNTRWIDADGPQDLLADTRGLRQWLAENDLAVQASEPMLHAVRTAREAILHAVRGESADELNKVLEHGRIRRTLTPAGPVAEPDIRQAEWLPAWLAADDLLNLLAAAPDRIKQCAHPNCVLWFHDTSKNGARRWHSMATCGNRAKATRHYAKKTHPDE
ncbi:CGNR zinc finger domain-containing protein [Nocardia sp. NBC_01503]|uniref:CGNR zinc finger domain-containing protein n=1 Tax=Nocardia sp. NBC_01503 TaxID=2975997 RepID=UPI002E7C21DB|nr:CGNR zinc finger domain-containing protein [Nocardia sp. NBC_01503]WTL29811.1 CGNR zinc finger domain-containing protein [Nocardia sp. NBC_01503]